MIKEGDREERRRREGGDKERGEDEKVLGDKKENMRRMEE
jgi:hypothetical protein